MTTAVSGTPRPPATGTRTDPLLVVSDQDDTDEPAQQVAQAGATACRNRQRVSTTRWRLFLTAIAAHRRPAELIVE